VAVAEESDQAIAQVLALEQHEDDEDDHQSGGGERLQHGAERRGESPEAETRSPWTTTAAAAPRGDRLDLLANVLDGLLHAPTEPSPASRMSRIFCRMFCR
jgi:hypothetical protein